MRTLPTIILMLSSSVLSHSEEAIYKIPFHWHYQFLVVEDSFRPGVYLQAGLEPAKTIVRGQVRYVSGIEDLETGASVSNPTSGQWALVGQHWRLISGSLGAVTIPTKVPMDVNLEVEHWMFHSPPLKSPDLVQSRFGFICFWTGQHYEVWFALVEKNSKTAIKIGEYPEHQELSFSKGVFRTNHESFQVEEMDSMDTYSFVDQPNPHLVTEGIQTFQTEDLSAPLNFDQFQLEGDIRNAVHFSRLNEGMGPGFDPQSIEWQEVLWSNIFQIGEGESYPLAILYIPNNQWNELLGKDDPSLVRVTRGFRKGQGHSKRTVVLFRMSEEGTISDDAVAWLAMALATKGPPSLKNLLDSRSSPTTKSLPLEHHRKDRQASQKTEFCDALLALGKDLRHPNPEVMASVKRLADQLRGELFGNAP